MSDLNDEQHAAVTYGEGPLLVVAGARIGEVAPVFPRLDRKQIMDEIKLEEVLPTAEMPVIPKQPAPEPAAPAVSEPAPGIA